MQRLFTSLRKYIEAQWVRLVIVGGMIVVLVSRNYQLEMERQSEREQLPKFKGFTEEEIRKTEEYKSQQTKMYVGLTLVLIALIILMKWVNSRAEARLKQEQEMEELEQEQVVQNVQKEKQKTQHKQKLKQN